MPSIPGKRAARGGYVGGEGEVPCRLDTTRIRKISYDDMSIWPSTPGVQEIHSMHCALGR